ncbi:hypothetical protein CGLO_18351 [Colletotrichum gloeosporioides Cg-14]|uniref:Uncharacterized protein n=1 Tax=Colletotrichum gloeosporioides (strain Cg-14) TaxID=1237896 RepID=T0JI78_COLGC|nr:hypothetical protein CGLO_18351 [Colletotrichum gloeosporioides Cg-14]
MKPYFVAKPKPRFRLRDYVAMMEEIRGRGCFAITPFPDYVWGMGFACYASIFYQ